MTKNKDRWIAHLNRVPDGSLPKEVCQYKPTGQQSIGSTGSFGTRTGDFVWSLIEEDIVGVFF